MATQSELNKLLDKSNKILNTYEKRVIKEYAKALKEIKMQYSTFVERGYNTANIEQLMNKIKTILNDATKKQIEITSKSIKENFKVNYEGIQKVITNALDTSEGFALLNIDKVNAAVFNKYSQINWQSKAITNTIKAEETVRSAITQGIIQGQNYSTVAKKISETLNVEASDAMRIVRTENLRATSEARKLSIEESTDAAERLGYTPVKIWNTSGVNTRDDHEALDGVAADENGMWTFPDGTVTEGPGLSGEPSQDINCRCFITVELQELGEEGNVF